MEKNIWRHDFPQIKDGLVYLDSAAMSLKPQTVIDKVSYYYTNLSTNIHRGLYPTGVETTTLYEQTREDVAKYIHALPEEVVFTRGTTSSLNLVAFSCAANILQEGDEIVTSQLEHHSAYLPFYEVAKQKKASIRFLELTQEGRITVEGFQAALTDKTKLVVLTYVSNVMGYISPIREITRLAHEKGIIVVVDGAQALPHLKIDVKELDIDFLAFSAHKMLGPTGIGILYGKYDLLQKMPPFEFGGDMNDVVTMSAVEYKDAPQKFEAGTMPVSSVLGFSDAIAYFQANDISKMEEHTHKLHRYCLARLSKLEGLEIYNPSAETAIIAFNLKNVPPHDAVTFYAEQNICMRSGHHCARMVSDFLGINGCLRASFYIYNDFKDVDLFVDATKDAIEFFKKMGF